MTAYDAGASNFRYVNSNTNNQLNLTESWFSKAIYVANAPSITQQPSPQNLSTGDDLQLKFVEGELLTYQWKKDGVNLTGQTANKLTIKDLP